MPLNGKELGEEIYKILTSLEKVQDPSDPKKIWQQVGDEIIRHIKENATITVTGVQSGPSATTGKIQ
jgi:hypothetical protein